MLTGAQSSTRRKHVVVLGCALAVVICSNSPSQVPTEIPSFPLYGTINNLGPQLSGVIGLTTAVQATELGHDVSIVSEVFPTDEMSIQMTSRWAGGHHITDAGHDVRQRDMDRRTLKEFWKLSEAGSPAAHCFLRIRERQYRTQEHRADSDAVKSMGHPNFRFLEPREIPEGIDHAIEFDTVTFSPTPYLQYLQSRFSASGGRLLRRKVHHVSEVAPPLLHKPADAIIVCTGLGAKDLGGVEDGKVYPIRGVTVIVKAPWVRFGRGQREATTSTCDVVLGGFKLANDWTTSPSPAEIDDILQRAISLCPELVKGHDKTVEELRKQIVEYGCGLRPGREGGIRIGHKMTRIGGTQAPVVWHYGHGGYGFQSSWGSAEYCMVEVQKVLRGNQARL